MLVSYVHTSQEVGVPQKALCLVELLNTDNGADNTSTEELYLAA